MRPLIAMLGWTLLFYGSPAWAERPEEIESTRLELEGESESPGVGRPWLRQAIDARLAQSGEETSPEDVDARIAELQAQRVGISRRWPTAGMIVGGVLTSAGITAILLNSICGFGDSWDDNGHDHSNCTGGWVAGGVLVGGGLTLFGTSAWFLSKRNHERRAIDRQIEKLKNGNTARRAPSFGLSFEAGERKGVRFAWRY